MPVEQGWMAEARGCGLLQRSVLHLTRLVPDNPEPGDAAFLTVARRACPRGQALLAERDTRIFVGSLPEHILVRQAPALHRHLHLRRGAAAQQLSDGARRLGLPVPAARPLDAASPSARRLLVLHAVHATHLRDTSRQAGQEQVLKVQERSSTQVGLVVDGAAGRRRRQQHGGRDIDANV